MTTSKIKSIAVFCGAQVPFDSSYLDLANDLGECLADQQIRLVYGGARVGLMGAVADGALKRKGVVVGVIPDFLVGIEVAHQKLTDQIIVKTMRERKRLMCEMSDAFVALPGGIGTLEEIFETITMMALGIANKPCVFLNHGGFYDPLKNQFARIESEGLLGARAKPFINFVESLDEIFEMLQIGKKHEMMLS